MPFFARPYMLWLVVMFPLVAAWVVRGWRRRQGDWSALGQGGRLRREGGAGWLVAIFCLTVALAQPRWGRSTLPDLPPGHDVVFLIDTSRSMGVEDAVPDRMGVAIEAALNLLKALRREVGNRAAVVAFAGGGRLRCPLTENLDAAADVIRALRPGEIQPGGTDLGAGLKAALEAFDEQDHAEGRTIVLLSDGEDHAERWDVPLEHLRESGIVVHSIAIGDPDQGHAVPSGRGSGTLTFEGKQVLSKRVDRPFEALARATGGAFVPLGLTSVDLGGLYRNRIAPVARQRREAIRPTEKTEQFPLFVAAALGFGLWGSWPRRGRRYAYAFRRGFGLGVRGWLVLGVLAGFGALGAGETAAGRVASGVAAYAQGKLPEALAAFEEAIALDLRAPVPRFNAAATLFRLERYPEALTRYREARVRAGAALRTKIDFALGNTAMAMGDLSGALSHYDDCLASTARGAQLDLVRHDAEINRRYAEEQARNPTTPPDPAGDDTSKARRSPAPKPGGDEGNDGDSERQGQGPEEGKGAGEVPPSGRQNPAGAGANDPSEPQPGSPEGRLAAALESIREARSRRLTEMPPPADNYRRDW